MAKLHIVYATDERYLLPTRVAAASAVYHASRPTDLIIDILDCGIAEDSWIAFEHDMRRMLGEGYGLVRYKVDMSAYAQYKTWHTSRGIYARLSIPDILPLEVDWCVYADGDTLFTADPFEIEVYFNDCYALIGCRDDAGLKQELWYKKHNFAWNAATYVCAGFIVMNLKWFREQNIARKSFELLTNYPDIPFNDQDALNILCKGHVGVFGDGWGVFACNAFRHDLLPKSIHYVGDRPWQLPCLSKIFLPDTSRLWFLSAKKTSEMNFADFGLSRLDYFRLYIKSRFMKFVFRVLSFIPRVAKRYECANSRFDCRWRNCV